MWPYITWNGVTAINAAGDAALSWVSDGERSGARPAYARWHPAGASWGPRVTLLQGEVTQDVRAVVDRRGNTTVLCLDGATLETIRRPHGGQWTTPHVLAERIDYDFAVGISRKGTVTATWNTPDHALVAARHPAGGHWRRPQVVAPPGRAGTGWLTLEVNAQGQSAIAWLKGLHHIYAAFAWRPGHWSRPQLVTRRLAGPLIGLSGVGTAAVVWPAGQQLKMRARVLP